MCRQSADADADAFHLCLAAAIISIYQRTIIKKGHVSTDEIHSFLCKERIGSAHKDSNNFIARSLVRSFLRFVCLNGIVYDYCIESESESQPESATSRRYQRERERERETISRRPLNSRRPKVLCIFN